MARDGPSEKLGSEHASGMFRQGLRELRSAMYTESNVAQQSEYGVFGTKTPGEVAADRSGDGRDLEDETPQGSDSILGERMRQAEGRDGHGRDDKELEPER
jgi:hypothetical protein